MPERVTVTDVRFAEAPEGQHRFGLLGWIRFTLNDLVVVDGVALRRTRDGRIVLSFPRRADRHGNVHYDCRPVDNVAREAIQVEVLAALGIKSDERVP
jgi:DNA-binding cell septation regulator SpoVG